MSLEKKNEILNKITNWSLAVLIIGVSILSSFKDNIPDIITNLVIFAASAMLYTSFLLRYKVNFGKLHLGLLSLAVCCIGLLFWRTFYFSNIVSLISVVVIYVYYIYGQKLMTGKMNKQLIILGIVITITLAINTYFPNKIVAGLMSVINVIIILKIVNPFFTTLAIKKKNKLEKDGFTDNDAKKVSRIRRILFGRTGKLDLSIVEMMTGIDLSKKNKRTRKS